MLNAFNFNGHELRVVEIDGEPWFVAADVCRCLDLTLYAGASQHVRHLAPDEKRVVRYGDPTMKQLHGALFAGSVGPGAKGGATSLTLITESGLYKLIMRSDKPEARAFQDWVTREVLPSIRKTGGYLLNEEARAAAHADQREQMPFTGDLFKAISALAEQNAVLVGTVAELIRELREERKARGGVVEEAEEGVDPQVQFDRDIYTAREVVMKLRLAGAAPSQRELKGVTMRVGQQLAALTRAAGGETRVVERYGYPVTAYPVEVVRQFAAAH